MNIEIKNKWLTALRSGTYKQTRGRLKNYIGFCCLGVLCDLYIKEHPTEGNWAVDASYEWYNYRNEAGILPPNIAIWADVNELDQGSLTELNDGGKSFSEIADIIEKEL